MKKLSLLLLLIASSSYAGKYDATVDYYINMMKTSGQIKQAAHCLDIKEDKMLNVYRKVMTYCMEKYTNDDEHMDEQNQCMEARVLKGLNISAKKMQKCIPDDENNSDEITPQQEHNLSEKELAAQVQSGLEQMQAMLDLAKKQSAGTENEITLPIYPNAKVIMHYQNGMEMEVDGKSIRTLPVATFDAQTSDILKIVKYYQKELPQFKMHSRLGIYYFAKKLPSNKLNMMDYANAMSIKPSVTVYQTVSEDSVVIQIVYQK